MFNEMIFFLHKQLDNKHKSIIYLAVLILGSFALKLLLFYQRRIFLGYDESYYLLLARNLFAGRGYILNGLPHGAFPPFLPILVGLGSLLTGSEIISHRLISAAAGAWLALPVWGLGYRLGGRKTGIIAALFVVTLPALNDMLNISGPYLNMLYAGSEPLYLLLLFTGIWLAIESLSRHSLFLAAATGAVLGLSFLTRPEGILFLFLISCIFLVWPGGGKWSRRLIRLAAILSAWVVVSGPYLFYLHHHSGRWMISAKMEKSSPDREALRMVLEDNDWSKFCASHYRLNPNGTGMASLYWGLEGALKVPSDVVESVEIFKVKEFATNLIFLVTAVAPRIFPLFLYPFVLLGIGYYLISGVSRRNGMGGFLGILALPLLFMGIFLYPVPRHLLPLAVILVIWGAEGCGKIAIRLGRSGGIRWLTVLPLLLSAGMFVNIIVRADLGEERETVLNSSELKLGIAREVRKHGQPEEIVMSWDPAIAVYSGRQWRVLPIGSAREILRYAKLKEVDLLVISRLCGLGLDELKSYIKPGELYRIVAKDDYGNLFGKNKFRQYIDK